MLPSRIFFDDLFDDVELSKKFDKMMTSDIYLKDGKYFIEMDLPGVKKENITMDIEKGYLTIKMDVKHDDEVKDERKYIKRERHFRQSCSRQFYVGDVNEEEIKAEFKDGILTVTVPKLEEKQTKRVINID